LDFNFIDLYPTRIWSLQADHLIVHHEQWLQAIENLRAQNPSPQGRSSRAAWNSYKKLFDDEVFVPLKTTLLESVASILKNQYNITEHRKATVVAWANVHEQAGLNTGLKSIRPTPSGCQLRLMWG
jgi:hypothetical protein